MLQLSGSGLVAPCENYLTKNIKNLYKIFVTQDLKKFGSPIGIGK